ncbi:hypothetical protein CF319_g8242 [Tilletia indica]|nr:hypothetical protein CF319_g8242 [Tilletia indica]
MASPVDSGGQTRRYSTRDSGDRRRPAGLNGFIVDGSNEEESLLAASTPEGSRATPAVPTSASSSAAPTAATSGSAARPKPRPFSKTQPAKDFFDRAKQALNASRASAASDSDSGEDRPSPSQGQGAAGPSKRQKISETGQTATLLHLRPEGQRRDHTACQR